MRASDAKLQAVAAGLSPAYVPAVRRNLPDAVLVNDRFHVVKFLNDHLAELRRELHAEAEGPLQKNVLKGTRCLLLKHPDHLDEKRNERQRLDDAPLKTPLPTDVLAVTRAQPWDSDANRCVSPNGAKLPYIDRV